MDWSKVPIKDVGKLAAKYEHPIDAIIYVAIAKAIEGDAKARRWLSETAHGKPKNGLIRDSEEERPAPVPIYGGFSSESMKGLKDYE